MSDWSVTIGSTADGPFPWKVWVQKHDGTWIEFGAFKTEDGADWAVDVLELFPVKVLREPERP